MKKNLSLFKRARGKIFTVAALSAAASLALAPAAAAEGNDLWYYDAPGFAEHHQRANGSGITIAVIDSAIRPDWPDLAGTNLNVKEPSYCALHEGEPAGSAWEPGPAASHGTSMVSLILGTGAGVNGEPGVKGVAPGATVNFYSAMRYDDPETPSGYICEKPAGMEGTFPSREAFKDAVKDDVDIISVSGTLEVDLNDLLEAYKRGIIIVTSMGNDGASYTSSLGYWNGVLGITAVTPDMQIAEYSNYGELSGAAAPGSNIRMPKSTFDGYRAGNGTSPATAIAAGMLATVWSAYPDATANQILQLMVRNTDGTTHEPVHDDFWGYGTINVRQMLADDPMKYPDVNPLLRPPVGNEIDDPFPSQAAIDDYNSGGDGWLTEEEELAAARGEDISDPADELSPISVNVEGSMFALAPLGLYGLIFVVGAVVVVSYRRGLNNEVQEQPAAYTPQPEFSPPMRYTPPGYSQASQPNAPPQQFNPPQNQPGPHSGGYPQPYRPSTPERSSSPQRQNNPYGQPNQPPSPNNPHGNPYGPPRQPGPPPGWGA